MGTGVQTAIGVNIGTAGAFVVNGGALGTPSSGTVTNLTGTASININGTVGATTANTGAFTTLSATGITTVAAGSAALPAIVSTTGTADTGFWFPAADTVAASTAATERLRIDSSGNVGIGTSSPLAKLNVKTLDATNAAIIAGTTIGARFSSDASGIYIDGTDPTGSASYQPLFAGGSIFGVRIAGAEKMRIDSSGNVGIGTSTPAEKLDVNGNSRAAIATSGDVYFKAQNSAGSLFFLQKSASAVIYTPTSQPLVFDIAGERVRINSSGNVGIGTASPNYKLEISTDSAGKPGVGGLWTVVSDERIKSNIVPANLDRCYEIVKSVPLKHFGFAEGVYSDDQIQDKHNLGWIAQDVQKVFKNAVSVKPFTPATGDVIEDCLDLNGGQMIAALYGAVQALMAIVDTQADRIAALEKGI